MTREWEVNLDMNMDMGMIMSKNTKMTEREKWT